VALELGRLNGTILNGAQNIYTSTSARRDIMLTNTVSGRYFKKFSVLHYTGKNGVQTTMSYTNQSIEDVHVSTSSTAR
jgi:hypothetical protein